LSRRTCRFSIKFKKAHSEDGAEAVSTEQWKKITHKTAELALEILRSAFETSLFHRVTTGGSLNYKHATLSGSKKATAHISVLCCSIMTGTDKR
jgi:hypothetical protein